MLLFYLSCHHRFLHVLTHSLPSSTLFRALVPVPVLIRKWVCLSLTCAPPTVTPRQPAASTSCHALCPSGFLKVEPPVFERSGCEASRLAEMRSISAWIACGSPGRPRKVAPITTAPSGNPLWR